MDGISITQVVEGEEEFVPVYSEMTSACLPLQPEYHFPSSNGYNGCYDEVDEAAIEEMIELNESSANLKHSITSYSDSFPQKTPQAQDDVNKILLVKLERHKLLDETVEDLGATSTKPNLALIKNRFKDVSTLRPKDIKILKRRLHQIMIEKKKLNKEQRRIERTLEFVERKADKEPVVIPNIQRSPHLKVKEKYKQLVTKKEKQVKNESNARPLVLSRSGRIRKLNIDSSFAISKEAQFLVRSEAPRPRTEPVAKPKEAPYNSNHTQVKRKVGRPKKTKIEIVINVEEENGNVSVIGDNSNDSSTTLQSQGVTPLPEDDTVQEIENKQDLTTCEHDKMERDMETENMKQCYLNDQVNSINKNTLKNKKPISKLKQLGYRPKRSYKRDITKVFKNYGEKIDFISNLIKPERRSQSLDPQQKNNDSQLEERRGSLPLNLNKERNNTLLELEPIIEEGEEFEDEKLDKQQVKKDESASLNKNKSITKKEKDVNMLSSKSSDISSYKNPESTEFPSQIIEQRRKSAPESKPKKVSNLKKKRNSIGEFKNLESDTEKQNGSEQVITGSVGIENRRKSSREVKPTERALQMICFTSDYRRKRASGSDEESAVKRRRSSSSKKRYEDSDTYKLRSISGPFSPNVSLENYLPEKINELAKSFESRWEPGDLVWSRITGSPFWPSILMCDPFANDEFSSVRQLGRAPKLHVHIQFLGDFGKRAYVPEYLTIPYEGLNEFNKLTNNLKLNKGAFFMARPDAFKLPNSPSFMKKWNLAIKEADKLLFKTKDERICYMKIKYPIQRFTQPTSLFKKEIVDSQTPAFPMNGNIGLKEEPLEEKEVTSYIAKPQDKDNSQLKIKLVKKPKKTKVKIENETPGILSECLNDSSPSSMDTRKKRDKTVKQKINGDIKQELEKERPEIKLEPEEKSPKSCHEINLFNGASFENICMICYDFQEDEKVLKCKDCFNFYHLTCINWKLDVEAGNVVVVTLKGKKQGRRHNEVPFAQKKSDIKNSKRKNRVDSENWECIECDRKKNPCFVCHEVTGVRRRCYVGNCGKFYHVQCLKIHYPQTKFNQGAPLDGGAVYKQSETDNDEEDDHSDEIVSCPRHVCHTCISENAKEDRPSVSQDRLVHCVKCPSTYHYGNYCVPAGSEIRSQKYILCGRHYEVKNKQKTSIFWCFLCSTGGSLFYCSLCPSAFHTDCLKLKETPTKYICEECESGRFPLFGEIVWAKLGNYRWWPAKILFPQQIPLNMWSAQHSEGQFVVQFFGSHDFYWISRGRAFLYQVEDHETFRKTNTKFDKLYIQALEEAKREFAVVKAERDVAKKNMSKGNSLLVPHYIKIKTNIFIGNTQPDASNEVHPICECDPKQPQPCSFDSNCLNRMLFVECSPNLCKAGKKCCNQMFKKRKNAPVVPYKTESRGWGLKCKRNLTQGEFIIEYVGEVIDEVEYRRRMKVKHDTQDENYYFLTVEKDRIIDAGPQGNEARFLNHSCDPNCEIQKWTVNGCTRIGVFANCDIPAGIELTFDYNLTSLNKTKKKCQCGSEKCAGFIGAKPAAPAVEKEKTFIRNYNKDTEDYCFICNEGGKVMICDVNECLKVYHLNCVGLTVWPKEVWFCPRHKCCLCSRSTRLFCKLCPRSFCSSHLDKNLKSNSNGSDLICTNHTVIKDNSFKRNPSTYVNRDRGSESEES